MNKKDTNDDWEATFDSIVLNSPDLTKDDVEWFKEEFERCSKLKDEEVPVRDWDMFGKIFAYKPNEEFRGSYSNADIWSAFGDYYENYR